MHYFKLLAVILLALFQNANAASFSRLDTEEQSIILIENALNLYPEHNSRPPNATKTIYSSGAHTKAIASGYYENKLIAESRNKLMKLAAFKFLEIAGANYLIREDGSQFSVLSNGINFEIHIKNLPSHLCVKNNYYFCN